MLGNVHKLVTIWVGVLSLLALTLAGCSDNAGPTVDEPDLTRLEQRVRERWEAKIARDYDRVWEYSTPNYRESFPKSMFALQFSYARDWELTSIEVVNYDGAAAVASVAVRVMSIPTKQTSAASIAIGATQDYIREQWLFIDGEWWYSASG
jgi:hypothetical protein